MRLNEEKLIAFMGEMFGDLCVCNYNGYDEIMCEDTNAEWMEKNCNLDCGSKCWKRLFEIMSLYDEEVKEAVE